MPESERRSSVELDAASCMLGLWKWPPGESLEGLTCAPAWPFQSRQRHTSPLICIGSQQELCISFDLFVRRSLIPTGRLARLFSASTSVSLACSPALITHCSCGRLDWPWTAGQSAALDLIPASSFLFSSSLLTFAFDTIQASNSRRPEKRAESNTGVDYDRVGD